MILVSISQKQILSFILIAAFILMIYLLFKFFKRNLKKSNETKMLSLNLVIKYNQFIKYLEYKESVNEDYSLYMVSINNFAELSNRYSENVIKLFIRRVVKNLSIMLPYGGKLAQTKARNTFILYVPKVSGSEVEFAHMLNNAAVRPYEDNQVKILENVSIGFTATNSEYKIRIEEANQALIASKRALGLITEYQGELKDPDENHLRLLSNMESSKIVNSKSEVIRTNINKLEGLYLDITINNKQFVDYLSEQPNLDASWMNIYLINKVLNNIDISNYNNKIYLPFILKTLEADNFIEALHVILQKENMNFNNIVLSIKNSIISKRNNIVKNILQLKELGAMISFETKIVDDEIYNTIKSYGINTLELGFNGNGIDDKLMAELNGYAKVHQINTLLISNNEDDQKLCTHHLKNIERVVITKAKQEKGKRSR